MKLLFCFIVLLLFVSPNNTTSTELSPIALEYEQAEAENAPLGMRPFDLSTTIGIERAPEEHVYINIRIHESECYSSHTTSTFTIYLASLSFENEFLSWYAIRFDQNKYFKATRTFNSTNIVFYDRYDQGKPENCFVGGGDSCVPRADVIFIQYDNMPEDSWSISHIEVDVQFPLWHGSENWHYFSYKHSVLMPCESWLDEVALYQIGPRIGQFIKVKEVPVPGQWIRDWI